MEIVNCASPFQASSDTSSASVSGPLPIVTVAGGGGEAEPPEEPEPVPKYCAQAAASSGLMLLEKKASPLSQMFTF
jgi:hypothetical protein